MADLNLLQPRRGPLLPPVFDAFCDFDPLPQRCTCWPVGETHSGGDHHQSLTDVQNSLRAVSSHGAWQWPKRPVVFISDPHADAESFLRSLVAAGTICRTGPGFAR